MNEQTIFTAVLDLDPAERSAFLDGACQNNQQLRERLEKLLQYHAAGVGILDRPGRSIEPTVHQSITEQPGIVIGRYKLLQQIGEGGMGVVFMAEQTEPLQRTVALKIIKPGMDTRQVIARFEAERQALALMDHPNIARVLDVGTTDAGLPYFVMDLVKGVPITTYCDQQHLPVRQRLELLTAVCHAVQHAHQKGIIHRDLKPSNVLVAEYDGQPVPKIIDFGVAKAIAQKLTEKTMFTELGQMVGTVEYMSPEQARFNQLDIDTRSDLYSLGVLLYELLTGSTPFGRKRLHEAAFDEMLRIIREEEPPKPSTRLNSSTALPSIAANRSLEPLKLNRLVRGELDWIVMKSLEKDRNRRYETATGFAADIQHYLNDETVEARPTTQLYRLRKFVRRNKSGVFAGGAIVAALLIGLTLASMGFVQARRQAQIAAAQASKATTINNLLQQMLKSANPNAAKGTDYTVRQMLDDFSAGLSDQLHDQPEVEAAIRATIGNAYFQLDQVEEAERHLKAALEMRQRAFGENHRDVASSYLDSANLMVQVGQLAEAESLLRKSLAIYKRLGIENDATIETLSRLGRTLYIQNKFDESDTVYGQAREMVRRQPNPDQQSELATILRHQALVAWELSGNVARAEQLARESLAINRRLLGNNHPEVAGSSWTLAVILGDQQKFDEAEQHYREAIAICREQFGDTHILIHEVFAGLAELLRIKGDLVALAALDAEQSANKMATLADCDRAISLHPNSWYRLRQRGIIYAMQGDLDNADADLARALELAPDIGFLIYERALVCFARHDDAGLRTSSEALAKVTMRGSDIVNRVLATQLYALAPDSAIDSTQALEFAKQVLEVSPPNGYAPGLYGGTLYRAGRYEEAARYLTESIDTVARLTGSNEPVGYSAYAYFVLAMAHHRLGNPKQAEDWMNRALHAIDARRGISADRLDSIGLKRLRQEAETLIGVPREEAQQHTAEMPNRKTPTMQPQALSDSKLPENIAPKADN